MDITRCATIPEKIQPHYQNITPKLETLRLLSPRLSLQIIKPTEIQQEILKFKNLKTEIEIYLQYLSYLGEEEAEKNSGGNYFGDSGGKFSGDSRGDFSGDSGGNFSGDSEGNYSGDSGGRFSGDSGGKFSGDSGGRFSGDSGRKFSGDSGGDFSGDSGGDFSGDSGGNFSGDSGGNFFGDSIASLTLHAIEKEIDMLTEVLNLVMTGDLRRLDSYTRKVIGVLGKHGLKCEKRKIEMYKESVKSRYTFVGKLGKGAYSFVLKAQHIDLKTMHAIKMANPALMNSKQKMRVAREIHINSVIQHKNIVNVLEIYQTDDQITFVMELCSGGNLFDFVVLKNKGTLSEDQAKCYIQGVLEAVHYLHSLGIAHRDLKPENLVFDKEGDGAVLKIIDFGFAKSIHDVGGLATPLGTPPYCPKETIYAVEDLKLGSIIHPYTPLVDMWAIGCIVYFMLFGTPPFNSHNPNEIDREIEINKEVVMARYKFPGNVNVSEDAKDFISHLLQKEPAKRMTSLEALNHPWIRRKPTSPPPLPKHINSLTPMGEPEINILRKSINQLIDAACKDEGEDEDNQDCGLEDVPSSCKKQ